MSIQFNLCLDRHAICTLEVALISKELQLKNDLFLCKTLLLPLEGQRQKLHSLTMYLLIKKNPHFVNYFPNEIVREN